MKKNVYYLLAMMMVAMMSVGFASCGGDDDDEGGSPNGSGTSGSSLIVGTWQSVSSEYYDDNWNMTGWDTDTGIFLVFNEGAGVVYHVDDKTWDADTFIYAFDGKTLNIRYKGGEKYTMEVITLSATELVTKEYDEDEWIVSKFKRVSNSVLPNAK